MEWFAEQSMKEKEDHALNAYATMLLTPELDEFYRTAAQSAGIPKYQLIFSVLHAGKKTVRLGGNIAIEDIKAASTPDSNFKRIERPIANKFWQFLHNVIAHPLLAIYRPIGLQLHKYTADKMYDDTAEEYMVDDNGTGING